VLSSRLSLVIAAATVALRLGLINAGMSAAIILIAIVTCIVSPLLFNQMLGTAGGRVKAGRV
jgi:hypothetical protein